MTESKCRLLIRYLEVIGVNDYKYRVEISNLSHFLISLYFIFIKFIVYGQYCPPLDQINVRIRSLLEFEFVHDTLFLYTVFDTVIVRLFQYMSFI